MRSPGGRSRTTLPPSTPAQRALMPLRGCRFFVAWIAAASLPALAGCGGHGEARKGPAAELPVVKAEVVTVQPQAWPTIVRAQGSLIADEVTIVGAKVAGRVAEINVDLGDNLAGDAKLAALEQDEF